MPPVALEEIRELYEMQSGRLQTLAYYMLGSRTAAEDAVQTAFLRAVEHRVGFRDEAAFMTWLWRIVVNHCHDELRRRKIRETVPLDSILGRHDQSQSPESRHAANQLEGIVARALLELSPKLRSIVVLRYVEELSYTEIASILGCSIGTVSSRLSRALLDLERILRPLRS